MKTSKINWRTLYMFSIILLGGGCLALLTVNLPIGESFPSFLFLCALAILAETQTITINDKEGVAITIAVTICAMISIGPTAAVWVAALSVLGTFSKVRGKGHVHIFNIPPKVTLFNSANYALGVTAMVYVYFGLGGDTLSHHIAFNDALLWISRSAVPLIASILASVFTNTLIATVYIALRERTGLFRTFVTTLLWSIISLIFVGLLGVIITAIYAAYGWFVLLVFFAPLVLARYVFSMYKELRQTYLETVTSLAAAIETKDVYTVGHSRRVEFYSGITAVQMGLSPSRCERLKYAALLHDIGKIGIEDRILNKPGKLDEKEIADIRTHPSMGAHIVEDIDFLAGSVDIIRSHHERLDGRGYPSGLRAEQISLEARILAAADSYDAMTSSRPYRAAMTHDEAVRELYAGIGTQFDGDVVKAFDAAMKKRGNALYVI